MEFHNLKNKTIQELYDYINKLEDEVQQLKKKVSIKESHIKSYEIAYGSVEEASLAAASKYSNNIEDEYTPDPNDVLGPINF